MKKRKLIILIITSIIVGLFSVYYVNSNKAIEKDEPIINAGIEDSTENDHTKDEPEEEEEKISTGTILAVGDIMFHTPQIDGAYDPNEGVYDFDPVFQYVKKYIGSADLSIGNLETVTAGVDRGYSGYPMFNSPESTLDSIKDSGFDVLTTINNHSLDQGREGLINTIDEIAKRDMKNIGTYKEPDTPILIEDVKGIELALLSYTYGFNGMEATLTEEEQSYMVNKIDEEKIKSDIEEANELGADMVVVFTHWGEEYHREPSEYQMELGRKMVDWGANIIFGSHPHVIQKSEIINKDGKDNFIIYSMGNFVSNQREETLNNPHTEDGIIIEIEIKKDFKKEETTIEAINYIPTWVRRYTKNGSLGYEILPAQDFLENEELKSRLNDSDIPRIKRSFEDTMEKMVEY